ncbi:hypothetical protein FHS55_003332 [Angulomicrobium tetraedrale]|uniref:Outer membrane protein beta-barrel domain-containing protein n=1 Tax=Ancylobacter tetraedralis TaxID=217068 RepID=A0A839ZD44_9HYPH|nr:hypothetical protein [Ancylobacter tetraedralis]MBB3772711.1 hypothetical protein [Ancylobacter tetraedralis]
MRNVCIIGLLGAVLMGSTAGAADMAQVSPVVKAPVPPADDWRFQATIYGWATGLNGNVGVRGLPPASVDVSAIDALTSLDGALMGSFFAQKDKWSFLFDLIYADLSQGATFGPLSATSASLGMTQVIVQGVAAHELPLGLPDNVALSGTVGFRYQHLSSDFSLSNPFTPLGVDVSGTKDWIDPTVGLFLQYKINDKWFVNALADVGGFGVSSKITAQGFASLGYMWTPAVSTALGYRAIYTDYEDGGFVYDVTQHGVFMSLGYHF